MSGIIGGAGSKSGVIDGLDIYAHLDNCSTTYGDMTFGTFEGDSLNITQSGVNVTLVKSGVYFITCTFNWTMDGTERYVFGQIRTVSGSRGSSQLSLCNDQIEYSADSSTSYGGATATFVGTFVGGDVIKFTYESGEHANAGMRDNTHASIYRIFR